MASMETSIPSDAMPAAIIRLVTLPSASARAGPLTDCVACTTACRAKRIGQARTRLMEPHAAQRRAGQPVATGAVDGKLAKDGQHDEAQQARELADHAELEGADEEQTVGRHEDAQRHQEAEQQLYR